MEHQERFRGFNAAASLKPYTGAGGLEAVPNKLPRF